MFFLRLVKKNEKKKKNRNSEDTERAESNATEPVVYRYTRNETSVHNRNVAPMALRFKVRSKTYNRFIL